MIKKTLLAATLACSLASCGSNDDNNVTPTNPTNPNPYYANFPFNGTTYNFSGTKAAAQYMSSFDQEVGGYMQNAPNIIPSVGISVRYDHHPTHTEVMALGGQTLSFDGASSPRARAEFSPATASDPDWWSDDTTSSAYSMHIESIAYVDVDTTIFNIVDVYEMKGSFSASMENLSTGQLAPLSGCNFKLLVSRVKD